MSPRGSTIWSFRSSSCCSRLQADDPLGNPGEVDIHDEMIAEAVDRCQVDAERHGVTLTGRSNGLPRGSATAKRHGVAVGNMVENAVVYSDPGARVAWWQPYPSSPRRRLCRDHRHRQWHRDPARAELERIFEAFLPRVDYATATARQRNRPGLSLDRHRRGAAARSRSGARPGGARPSRSGYLPITAEAAPQAAQVPARRKADLRPSTGHGQWGRRCQAVDPRQARHDSGTGHRGTGHTASDRLSPREGTDVVRGGRRRWGSPRTTG